jgi:Ketosteroid isomerase homolog
VENREDLQQRVRRFQNSKRPRLSRSKSIDVAFNSGLDDIMKTKPLFLLGCFVLLSFAFVGTAAAGDTKIEQELRDRDAKWSAAAGAKDIDKTVSYYSEDAVVMPPNAPSAKTRETIRSAWKEMLTTPGAAISWKATKVEVAKSGDLACVSGTYEETTTDASGKPVKDHGKYVEVWEKQADGTWKCGADIWNSDLPATPAEKK